MKKLVGLFILLSLIYSCSKKSNDLRPITPSYLGIYTSSTKDTVKVVENGSFIKFVYSTYVTIHTPVPPPTAPSSSYVRGDNYIYTFDSVRVASDLGFTDNEIFSNYRYSTGTEYPLPPPFTTYGNNTGTGTFGTNTVIINFDAITFNGVKL